MKPTQDELMNFAHTLAKLSAATIKPYFRSGYAVDIKSDASPVTVADREGERVMRELIMRTYPDHGILGEEFGHHQADADYQWVLDPIDGTKSFIAHSYNFGTLIALTHRGRPQIGVINQPIVDDFLIGDGSSTWLNGKKVSVRPCKRIEDAWLSTTEHWNVFNYQNGAAFEELTKRVAHYRIYGDCFGYYTVAVGGIDIMMDPIMNAWDLLALIPVIEGAGGRISNWQGEDAAKYPTSSVATAGEIHDEVIRALNP